MSTPSAAPRTRRPLPLRRKMLFAGIVTCLAVAVAYAVVLIVLSEQLYRYVSTSQRSLRGDVWRADDELGYVAVAGARGESLFPAGPSIPIVIDDEGFRVPDAAERAPATGDGALLALGCSYTFGAACRAEHTFVERVGREHHLRVRNAGGNGYGLVQMLRLGRRLIERVEPDVLLLEYAPWLVTRARNDMAPSYFGRLPVPWFAATDDERLEIAGPMFRTIVPELPLDDYGAGGGGRLSFYMRCGVPLFVHDHLHVLWARCAGWPAPELDRAKVVRLCYAELARHAEQVGARAVVVVLGPDDPNALAELERLDGLEIVAAEGALWRALGAGAGQQEYERTYGHWRGDPPQLVDTHPNPLAHRLIAEQVSKQLSLPRPNR